MAPALLDQSVGDDAELLPVYQGLPVGVGRGGHEKGVDLTLYIVSNSLP